MDKRQLFGKVSLIAIGIGAFVEVVILKWQAAVMIIGLVVLIGGLATLIWWASGGHNEEDCAGLD